MAGGAQNTKPAQKAPPTVAPRNLLSCNATPMTTMSASASSSPHEYDSENLPLSAKIRPGFISSLWSRSVAMARTIPLPIHHARARSWTLSHERESTTINCDGPGPALGGNVTSQPLMRMKNKCGSFQRDLGFIQFHEETLPPYDASVHAFTSPPPYSPMSKTVASRDFDVDRAALPLGTPLYFFANLLLSVSFQFVGFILTFLFHTTRAAKYGSLSGLGITLMQFAVYSRLERAERDARRRSPEHSPMYRGSNNASLENPPASLISERTGRRHVSQPVITGPLTAADWISAISMILGILLFLTSVFNYWRVLRLERLARRHSLASMMEAHTDGLTPCAQLFTNHHIAMVAEDGGRPAYLERNLRPHQHTALLTIEEIC